MAVTSPVVARRSGLETSLVVLTLVQVVLVVVQGLALHVPNALLVLVAQGVLLVGGRREAHGDVA